MSKGSPTNNELSIILKNLSDKVEDGFRGVHERQDVTNGKVNLNTEFRLKATGSIDTMKWLVGLVGISNLIILAKVLF